MKKKKTQKNIHGRGTTTKKFLKNGKGDKRKLKKLEEYTILYKNTFFRNEGNTEKKIKTEVNLER